MRRPATALLVLGLLAAPLGAASSQKEMQKSLEQMQNAASAAEAKAPMEFILAHAETAPSVNLLFGSMAALANGRVEDAGFLFYAGQLRARMDLTRFPSKEPGGSHASVAVFALTQTLGQSINPAVMREPAAFRAAVERIDAWHPVTPADYDPGWAYGTKASEEEATREFESRKSDMVSHFRGLVSLLEDPKYFAAFRTLQDVNLAGDDKDHPTEKERADAAKTMREMETARKIEGLFYRKPGS